MQKHLVILVAFVVGVLVGNSSRLVLRGLNPTPSPNLDTLRLEGQYQFISPLIACNSSSPGISPQLQSLEAEMQALVDSKIRQGVIENASVYFRDYSSNESIVVNPDEKYYPASLNKIPVLIASYKLAEKNPDFLKQEVVYGGNDENVNQLIKPAMYVDIGETVTIQEALTRMIKYSDNNAFYLLAQHVDPKVFTSTYKDLQIPMRESVNTPADFMTVENFSYFLRTLYNATYLNKDYSEAALKTLSEVDYKNGLVAGVPTSVPIAHKFGHGTTTTAGKNIFELHDCGIVYAPNNHYLLCVMTKTDHQLEQAQSVIQELSTLVYDQITRE